MKWLAYISKETQICRCDNVTEGHLINIDAESESEAIKQAEIEANGILGDGWKADGASWSCKIILVKAEKEILVFERE